MPRIATDPQTGERFVEVDGEFIPAPATTSEEAQQIAFQAQLRSFGRTIRGMMGADRDELRLEELEENELLRGVRAERPVSTIFGSALPAGLPTLGVSTAATLPGGITQAAGLGAIEGALDFDPESVNQLASTAKGTAFGVTGDIAGRMAGRVLNGIMSIGRATRPTARAAKALEDVGGVPTAGQRIDDPTLRSFEASLSADAMTNRVFEEIGETNLQVGNAAALRSIGLQGDDLLGGVTEDALDKAATQMTSVFDAVSDNVGRLEMGKTFGDQVITLEQFRKLRGLGDLPNLPEGIIDGEDVMTVRSALSEEMSRAFDRGQGQLGSRIRSMIEELDNTLEQATSPQLVKAFARAREQWRNLRILEGTNVVSGNNVNPVTFNKRLRTQFGSTATRGRMGQVNNPETAELIQTMKALADPKVRPIVPTSGTAERQAVREAISDPVGATARGMLSPLVREFEGSPRAASVVGALLSERAPLIFPRAGRAVGVGAGEDALNQLIFGENQ